MFFKPLTRFNFAKNQSMSSLDLSPREKEILSMVMKEYSSKDIAENLAISPRTVETHRKNIMRKTGSKSLIALTKFAIRKELLTSYYFKAK